MISPPSARRRDSSTSPPSPTVIDPPPRDHAQPRLPVCRLYPGPAGRAEDEVAETPGARAGARRSEVGPPGTGETQASEQLERLVQSLTPERGPDRDGSGGRGPQGGRRVLQPEVVVADSQGERGRRGPHQDRARARLVPVDADHVVRRAVLRRA